MLEYDITIIGAGPAGYVAAIKAGQEGYKTLCIDKRDVYGGTCLNVGCIPSKVLLEATHSYAELNYVNKYGIVINSVSLDLDKLMQYKNSVIHDLNHGIQHLFKKYKVDFIGDQAEILDANHINLVKTNQKIFSKNIIIATGSVPATIPGITIDEKTIVSSTGALNLNKIPNKMVVIGAGVIGLEMASIWSRLGSQVNIIEYSDMILGGLVDKDVSDTIKKIMPDINFIMNAKVTSVHNSIPLQITYEQDNQLYTIDNCDIVLIAVGRKPNISGLGLEKIGITLNKDGTVMVKNFQTNLPSIYAIGDVIPGPMLAHKASQDGIAVIDIIKNSMKNYTFICH